MNGGETEQEQLRAEAVEAAADQAPDDARRGLPAIVWIPLMSLILLVIVLLFAHPAIVS